MPTEMHTICFHTRDAVERHDSTFTFDVPKDGLRTGAAKVALASCEFPMVQMTVEKGWDRLYLNEGCRLTPSNNLLEMDYGYGSILLPPRLNEVESVSSRANDSSATLRFAHPHGLWGGAAATRPPLANLFRDVTPQLLGARPFSLRRDDLEYVDERTIRVKNAPPSATHLLVPSPPSPSHLCGWLTSAASRVLPDGVRMRFEYHGGRDAIVPTLSVDAEDDLPFRFVPTPLLSLCGISEAGIRIRRETSPAAVPSAATRWWDYVELPCGFYAPCHRPMSTGQPMRMGTELEQAVNRFYFPLQQERAAHVLVFSDADGRVLTCDVPPGRYSPESLCECLTRGMSEAARKFDASAAFRVTYDHCRFRIESSSPSSFGLMFHHPLCLDPSRLGFPPQPLGGSSCYVSSQPCKVACVDGEAARNVIRVSEVASQKRFRLHSAAPPPMVAYVLDGAPDGEVALRTHVNKALFEHGFRVGDVVRVASTVSASTKLLMPSGEEVDVPTSPSTHATCVVTRTAPDCVLVVRSLVSLAPGTALSLSCDPEPWSLHFGLPGTVPASLMGFAEAAVLWGIDGSVPDGGGRKLPPYDAPHMHCLDHPDYILMTFSESGGMSLEHSYAGEVKNVFCKLSLYPQFREERMLPRDSTLLASNLGRFQIAFWNPDMRTPYCFNGAHFSFSLSFLSALPDP